MEAHSHNQMELEVFRNKYCPSAREVHVEQATRDHSYRFEFWWEQFQTLPSTVQLRHFTCRIYMHVIQNKVDEYPGMSWGQALIECLRERPLIRHIVKEYDEDDEYRAPPKLVYIPRRRIRIRRTVT